MKVVACDGNSYLISLEDDLAKANTDISAKAQVLDKDRNILYPPTNLHSIYSKGYWESCVVSDADLEQWLDDKSLKVILSST